MVGSSCQKHFGAESEEVEKNFAKVDDAF